MSAIALLVLIETGMCMDRNRVVTITELNLWTALTQADGFRCVENPLFLQDLSLPILVHLPLLSLPLKAMNRLVVVGFEYSTARLKVVLHRIYSCHPLSPHVLDWDVESTLVILAVCSTYAEGNCGSGVPFCGMYNTQLRGDLSSFLLLAFVAYILLVGCTSLVTWLRDLSLHSRRLVLLYVPLMCPWRLGQLILVWASTLLDERWLYHHGVLSAAPSYGYNPVGD